jgi:hypothetical protein
VSWIPPDPRTGLRPLAAGRAFRLEARYAACRALRLGAEAASAPQLAIADALDQTTEGSQRSRPC